MTDPTSTPAPASGESDAAILRELSADIVDVVRDLNNDETTGTPVFELSAEEAEGNVLVMLHALLSRRSAAPAPAGDAVARVARLIATAMGYDYDGQFANMAVWLAAKGKRDDRVVDVNEPYQCDFLDAAIAFLAAIPERGRAEQAKIVGHALHPSTEALKVSELSPDDCRRYDQVATETKAEIEALARAFVHSRVAEVCATDDVWPQQAALYWEMCAKYPGYEGGRSLINDAFRDAMTALSFVAEGRLSALAAAETRGLMRAAEIAEAKQQNCWECDGGYGITEAIRAAASQPVEAGREDGFDAQTIDGVQVNRLSDRQAVPRVVDHPEAGYSEWRREKDVPANWRGLATLNPGVVVALAQDDNRFVGVRWPLAPQPREGEAS